MTIYRFGKLDLRNPQHPGCLMTLKNCRPRGMHPIENTGAHFAWLTETRLKLCATKSSNQFEMPNWGGYTTNSNKKCLRLTTGIILRTLVLKMRQDLRMCRWTSTSLTLTSSIAHPVTQNIGKMYASTFIRCLLICGRCLSRTQWFDFFRCFK